MKVLHNNVLVTQAHVEQKTSGGIILSGDVTSGNKLAVVIATGETITDLPPKSKVYLDWSKSMPVEIDGLKCAVIDYAFIKLKVE
jgi:co-chaperonin GroES (HSP10)